MRVSLEIDRVRVRTEKERHRVEGVAPAVQEAFRALAARLERTPMSRFDDGPESIVLTLESETVPLDELLTARGAERLADRWYRTLMERLR
jgi:hypothetical protein